MDKTLSRQRAGTLLAHVRVELAFIRGLVGINLASAMEYRATFLTQIFGMFLNNGIYFVFWYLFFDRFGTVQGYNLEEVYLLFAIVAMGFGLAYTLAGNTGWRLATIIAQGRLDYYLALPRNLLAHVLFSHMVVSAIGDFFFGIMAFFFAGRFHPAEIVLFVVSCVLSGCVIVGYGLIVGSAAFFFGGAQQMSMQAANALVSFALYPNTLFSGFARLLLYTLIPAIFIGGIPVDIVLGRDGRLLAGLAAAAAISLGMGTWLFYAGLRRYESGSAINVM